MEINKVPARRTNFQLFEEVVYGTSYLPYTTQSSSDISSHRKEKCERHAEGMWNKFYKNNTSNFFKDRHYLYREFPELLTDKLTTILEFGCGVGNSTFPLLEINKNIRFYAFDFSETALDVLSKHSNFPIYKNRIHLFHWDPASSSSPSPPFLPSNPCDDVQENNEIVDEEWRKNRLPTPNSCDLVLLIFVLSAISPDRMNDALQHIYPFLKDGAVILFRDYADGDLAQARFIQKKSILGNNYYLRSDGTFSFFFTPEYLTKLCNENGFTANEISLMEKEVVNHKENKVMNRVFIQAKLIKNSQNK